MVVVSALFSYLDMEMGGSCGWASMLMTCMVVIIAKSLP